MYLKRILLVILILTSPSLLFAETPENDKFKVKLIITADDMFSAPIDSYLKRELRSLNDVEIVEDNPEYGIHVAAMKITGGEHGVIGVAFSVVFTEKFYNQWLLDLVSPTNKQVVEYQTSNIETFQSQGVFAGSDMDIKRLCENVIVDFDNSQLEPSRKIKRAVKEMIKRSKPKGELKNDRRE